MGEYSGVTGKTTDFNDDTLLKISKKAREYIIRMVYEAKSIILTLPSNSGLVSYLCIIRAFSEIESFASFMASMCSDYDNASSVDISFDS